MQGKSILKLACMFVVACLCLTGLNIAAAPIIEKNAAAGEFGPLFEVMEGASGFEALTDLENVDEKVTALYRETSGMGYVAYVSTTEGYTHEPIEFVLAFDAEGKISNINIISNPETKDWGQDYPSTYIGQDSTLANVQLVAGVTYASNALKNATLAAFDALINNDLLKAGQKGPEQILTELLADTLKAFGTPLTQYEEVSANGFDKSLRALNGAGSAFIKVEGDNGYVALVNSKGNYAVYDMEGNDVTESKADIGAAAAANVETTSSDKNAKKMASFAGVDESSLKPVSMEGVFSSVVDAYKIGNNYGFVCKSYGFEHNMTEMFVLDQNGAIVKMTVDEIIQEADYFNVKVNDDAYKAGFVGVTVDTFDGSQSLITGATISTVAVSTATEDVFNAYQTIVGGNN